ncbi:hypothetical protein DYQ86_25085 [Acidobacteria bacterium AB60]|nr:hypothetical protein DYQ86_25085 [Acidobacteria bacterium AB60]
MSAAAALVAAGCGESHIYSDPRVVWPTPAAIAYGKPLSEKQLNATAAAAGTFTYSPAAGVCLRAGDHSLTVTFTPSDAERYQSATKTVTLRVDKAMPRVEWQAPAPVGYGTALSGAQLNASVAGIAGTLRYEPSVGSVLPAGTQALTAIFTPQDTEDYETARTTVPLTVMKAVPLIYWPRPVPMAAGKPLTRMQLDAMADGVAGTFQYVPGAGSTLPAGEQELTARFTPADSENYEEVTAVQKLTVHDGRGPSIAVQPQEQTVAPGGTATFAVTASGAGYLAYQWLRNGVAIPEATAAAFTTAPVRSWENGSRYSVVVSNGVLATTSAAARLVVITAPAARYFVAMNGNDGGDGSAAAPFATLQRAQQAMQASGIKVTEIGGGTYYLGAPLTLTAADQGETWEAAPGETAILSGGAVLTDWSAERDGIYTARAAQPVGVDLTVGGIRLLPADRGFDADEPYTSGWNVVQPILAQTYSSTFGVAAEDITASVKPGALVQIIDHYRWTDVFTRILSVDRAARTITVATAFDTGTCLGYAGSWRVLGDPADLSGPGQFGYDAATATVYVRPGEAEDVRAQTVVAAQLGTLIALKNTSGITISGLVFSDTVSDTVQTSGAWDDWKAPIMAEGLSASTIAGNTFRNTGRAMILAGSSDDVIFGNTLEGLGVAGIHLLSNSNRNTIAGNVMRSIGEINLGSYAVAINDGSQNTVDGNLIDGVGRWGIVFGPSGNPNDAGFGNTGNVFSHNLIRNTSNRTNDTGAIYGGAGTHDSYFDEDLRITGNRIENVGGMIRELSGRYDAGFAQAIYLDDHLSGVTVTDNVMESGSTYGVVLCHGCRSNSASNNVVVLQPAPSYDRGAYGGGFASGAMNFSGTTWIDLLPSYFPESAPLSTIVVRLRGESYAGRAAAFRVEVDGVEVGTRTAANAESDYVFKLPLEPHRTHRIGIALTNGSDFGATTTALRDLQLMVNGTLVSLAAPEVKGAFGSYGIAAFPDDLRVTHFSVTGNIVYRNGGRSQDVFDGTRGSDPAYADADPGEIGGNILYEDVSAASTASLGVGLEDAGSLVADPRFVNAWRGDYRLEIDSAALRMGFEESGVPLGP